MQFSQPLELFFYSHITKVNPLFLPHLSADNKAPEAATNLKVNKLKKTEHPQRRDLLMISGKKMVYVSGKTTVLSRMDFEQRLMGHLILSDFA